VWRSSFERQEWGQSRTLEVNQRLTTNQSGELGAALLRLISVLEKTMTQKDRGDFDAVILSINARLSGIDLSPPIQEWIAKRLCDGAVEASIRVASQIKKAGQS
jgi:hypothetical protein